MTKKTCPLGEDCDLTIAWMLGWESAKDEYKARIEAAGGSGMTKMYMRGRVYYGTAAEMMDRIDELEAKLAKAVEALEKLDVGEGWAAQIARATIAELTGGKDE